jgi:hypothetical protein
MGLNIEFIDPQVTREDIDRYIKEKLIRFNPASHELQTLPNGNLAIFVKNVGMPGLETKINGRKDRPRPMIPDGLEIMYIFRGDIFENPPREGIYSYGEDIESMSVQRVKDVSTGKVKTVVEIRGTNLVRIEQAYNQVRSRKLPPTHDWSSPGTVEAPKADDNKEPSGSRELPPKAATATAA